MVFRNRERTAAALAAAQGPVPEGYQELSGSGYLLAEAEVPWLLSPAGLHTLQVGIHPI